MTPSDQTPQEGRKTKRSANPSDNRRPRDGFGRFVKLVCVNATDRCAGSFPCPFCEPSQ